MAVVTRHQNDRILPNFNEGISGNTGKNRQNQDSGLRLSKYTARPPPGPVQPTTKDLSVPLILLDQDSCACPGPMHHGMSHGGFLGVKTAATDTGGRYQVTLRMAHFNQRAGTTSAVRRLKNPFPDVMAFNAVVQSLVLKNPLGCMSYRSAKKHHPPVEKVREMYTAKFVYLNAIGKQIGIGLDMYNSIEGYQYGIAAVISNMANIAAHGGKVRHVPAADLFSVILKCNDPKAGLFFLSIARDRVTISSYSDDAIRARVETWADGVSGLK